MRRGMYTGCVRDSHLHRVFRGVIGPDFCFISITKCSNAHEPVHFSILRYFLNKVNKKQAEKRSLMKVYFLPIQN